MVPGPGIPTGLPRRSSTRRTVSRAAGATRRATAGARTCATSTWTGILRAQAPRIASSSVVTAIPVSRSRSAATAPVGCFVALERDRDALGLERPERDRGVDRQVRRVLRGRAHGHRQRERLRRGRRGRAGARRAARPRASARVRRPALRRPYNETPMLAPPPLLPRPDPRRRRLLRLYDRLHRRYGPQRWWPARSRFEVVVGAILTQNAAWRNAERAIARLRAAGALDLRGVLALSPARLAALLRPSGTFRVKARRLRAFARHVARRHGGRLGRLLALPLPALRAELRGIAGIGPETADAIALYAAGRPIFVVDAYTRRILARHRLVAAGRGLRDRADALHGRTCRTIPRSSTSSTRSWSASARSTAGRGRAARAARSGSTSGVGGPGSRRRRPSPASRRRRRLAG